MARVSFRRPRGNVVPRLVRVDETGVTGVDRGNLRDLQLRFFLRGWEPHMAGMHAVGAHRVRVRSAATADDLVQLVANGEEVVLGVDVERLVVVVDAGVT